MTLPLKSGGPWTSFHMGMPGLDIYVDWIDHDHYIYFRPTVAGKDALDDALEAIKAFGLRASWDTEEQGYAARIIPLVPALSVAA